MNIETSGKFSQLIIAGLAVLLLNGCSTGRLVAQSSLSLMQSGEAAMNRETDFELAKAAIPANLKMIESIAHEIPDNRVARLYAAQGFYGYAYGFVEDIDPKRASTLYRRGMEHGRIALERAGLAGNPITLPLDSLVQQLAGLGPDAVPELFWTASNWGKWVELNLADPARIADLGKIEALMKRVLELDQAYYYGGPHLFLGVWYGSRPPMLGGDFSLSKRHFHQARRMTEGKLLIADLLEAQYLDVQQGDRRSFHDKLIEIMRAPPDRFPEMALANAIARHKAQGLLAREEELF